MGKQIEAPFFNSSGVAELRERMKFSSEEIILGALKAGINNHKDLLRVFEDFRRKGLTIDDINDFYRALKIMTAFDVIKVDGDKITLNEDRLFGPIIELAEHLSHMIKGAENKKLVEVQVEK